MTGFYRQTSMRLDDFDPEFSIASKGKSAKNQKSKKKKKIFLSAFRSHLRIKQKELGILPGIKIPRGHFNNASSGSGSNSSLGSLKRSKAKKKTL
jgi:hypothetical protein